HGPGVTGQRVLLPRLPEDQHGEFGQVVTGQDVNGTTFDHLPGRGLPIAVETGRIADPHRSPRHVNPRSRPGPAGPANACAIAIHARAVSPETTRPVSSRCRRWVTTRQKSSAVPVTRSRASEGPHRQVSPSGPTSSTRIGWAGTLI